MSNAREQWEKWQHAQLEQERSEKAIVDDGEEKPIKGEDFRERWANTFSQRRKFFRLWVTVSPKPVVKKEDRVWF